MAAWYDAQIATQQRSLGLEAVDQATLTRALRDVAEGAEPVPDDIRRRYRQHGIPMWAWFAADCRPPRDP